MSKSMRWRIQFWHAVILATVIAAFGVTMYSQQHRSRFQEIDSELSAAVEVLIGKLQSAPISALHKLLEHSGYDSAVRDDEAEKLEADLELPGTFAPRRLHHKFETPYFVIWRKDGTEVKASESPNDVTMPVSGDPSHTRRGERIFRTRGEFRDAFAYGPNGSLILVGRWIEKDRQDIRNLFWLLTTAGFGILGLGLFGGALLSRNAVRPVATITQVAADISEKDLSHRIDPEQMDLEFVELSDTLNHTFARLESAFARQKQFTADASHELRTPLSILKMHQELALSGSRTSEEYQETLQTCQRATARMTSLVESLLTLARVDSDGLTLKLEDVDVSGLVASVVTALRPVADAKSITFVTDTDSVVVQGDRDRLVQVLENLLTNAVTYSQSDGEITISTKETDQGTAISVTDSGVGIPKSEQETIFRRFYRVDKQRTRDSGGSGLGLAICRCIVEAHGGTITVTSSPDVGSTFTFTIPRTLSPKIL